MYLKRIVCFFIHGGDRRFGSFLMGAFVAYLFFGSRVAFGNEKASEFCNKRVGTGEQLLACFRREDHVNPVVGVLK